MFTNMAEPIINFKMIKCTVEIHFAKVMKDNLKGGYHAKKVFLIHTSNG